MKASYHLIYDGDCGLCQQLATFIQQRDRHHRVRALTFNDSLAEQLLAALPREQWRNTFHVVLPDGTRKSGDAALAPLVALLPGGRPVSWLMRHTPLGRPLTTVIYRWLAARHVGR